MTTCSFSSAIAFSVALAGTALAGTAPGGDLLRLAGERVERFWEEFPMVACTETVEQSRLGAKGSVVARSRSEFDYLMLTRWDGDELEVEESRLPAIKKPQKRPDKPLLATRGFATLLLILHPVFQPSYEFTALADERLDGRTLARVGFAHRRGARSPALLELRGRSYPIEWQGVAWLDADSGAVVRIEAAWREPAAELGLQTLASDARYAPVTFHGSGEPCWLPRTAAIEVKTQRQHWRNIHRFDKYRVFAVDTAVRMRQAEH